MELTKISPKLHQINPELVQPGQIWEVRRQVLSPLELELTAEEKQYFYSHAMWNFLEGNAPPRYVMIVKEPEEEIKEDPESQVISVMLLSVKTQYLNSKNLLIPATISGLEQDLLAETWNIVSMLVCNLLRPVGKRLSREIYDMLLDIGEFEQGLVEKSPSPEEIIAVGLQVGSSREHHPEFDQQELDWKTLLEFPVALYHVYKQATSEFDAVLLLKQLETGISEVDAAEISSMENVQISLNQWFQGIIETGWQKFEDVFGIFSATPALEGWRGVSGGQTQDVEGEMANIKALVEQIETTEEDEILWNAVAQLRQLQPNHLALGVRKVKLLDFGGYEQTPVLALTVSLIPRENQEIRVLLQVDSINTTLLPSDLKMLVLDQQGETVLESTEIQGVISIALQGFTGEKFSVKVTSKNFSIIEKFCL
ncbi:MAG TPA: DUF1822 family protein [Candidatus Obscuribacterales bacterium]